MYLSASVDARTSAVSGDENHRFVRVLVHQKHPKFFVTFGGREHAQGDAVVLLQEAGGAEAPPGGRGRLLPGAAVGGLQGPQKTPRRRRKTHRLQRDELAKCSAWKTKRNI